ncbi:hypothetical protein [Halosimplex sp. J119]
MSQSPLDGSDREGRSVADADRGTESTSLVGRVVERVRSVGRSLRARLPSVTNRPDEYDAIEPSEPDRPARSDRSRSVQCVGLTEEVLEGDGRAVTDDLVRVHADERDDRDGPDDDRPELVVERSEEELTLSVPDDPGAHITSTHWEDVER